MIDLETFPLNAKFKYSWRNYQQTVLDQLDVFLENNHLHIIAPPGSGKTVLGLEAMLRLNKPTLILSPTLTIRDQWINRLCELFLGITEIPDWISTDIRKPNFLTVITYQGLYSACSDVSSFDEIIKKLKDARIETFVLDEAHHLKNQWWITLDKVKKSISSTVIGLTATPPYDSSYTEWQRYLDMNGEIDMEISVPELVKEGDLCPHQDYVYFSQPTQEEFKRIRKYRDNISRVFEEYSKSKILIDSFLQTDIWLNPENYLEWIYENLPIYTSYLILLIHNDIEIPEIHLKVLGLDKKDKKTQIPELLYDRLEVILNYFLFQDKVFFTDFQKEKEDIYYQLRGKGVIDKNSVKLVYNANIDRLLTSSNSKLRSIIDIVRFEHTVLGEQLRMVVLSDYIREEYLNSSKQETQEMKKIGVIPIFETLLENEIQTTRLGVLTGSLVILPKSSLQRFKLLCEDKNIPYSQSLYKEYREDYIIISNGSAIKDSIVEITTQLFAEGEIEILIGTKSLLGEGWDAPCINSLILASFIGSFVLSNQMRGRAIRIQRDNSTKTSNIWHLACIDPTAVDGGHDLEVLSRRFKSFVGVSNTEEVYIENGLDRLDIKRDKYTENEIIALNRSTLEIAKDRELLIDKWEKAIAEGTTLIDEIKIPYSKEEQPYKKSKGMYFYKTIAYLVADLLMLLTIFGYQILEIFFDNIRLFRSLKDIIYFLVSAAVMGLLFLGGKTYKTLKLYIRYRDISKDFENIGKVLLKSLIKQGAIKSAEKDLVVESKTFDDGTVYCYLKGATRGEQAIFINSFKEILSVVDNPRYIIIRKGDFWKIRKDDYNAVPNLLGINKKLASYFHELWSSTVGRSQLVYTRTIEGRKLLLKARIDSLSAKFNEEQGPQEYRKWS